MWRYRHSPPFGQNPILYLQQRAQNLLPENVYNAQFIYEKHLPPLLDHHKAKGIQLIIIYLYRMPYENNIVSLSLLKTFAIFKRSAIVFTAQGHP